MRGKHKLLSQICSKSDFLAIIRRPVASCVFPLRLQREADVGQPVLGHLLPSVDPPPGGGVALWTLELDLAGEIGFVVTGVFEQAARIRLRCVRHAIYLLASCRRCHIPIATLAPWASSCIACTRRSTSVWSVLRSSGRCLMARIRSSREA